MGHEKGLCFVICPIGPKDSAVRRRSDALLEHVFRPAADACGYGAKRADEFGDPGSITTKIIDTILTAPMVIADLSGFNANVFYELALRHATRKPFVQVIQEGEKPPFDVADLRTIDIGENVAVAMKARQDLVEAIALAESKGESIVTPVAHTIDMMQMRASGNPTQRGIVDVLTAVEALRGEVAAIRKPALGPVMWLNPTGGNLSVAGQIVALNDVATRVEALIDERDSLTASIEANGDRKGLAMNELRRRLDAVERELAHLQGKDTR